MSEPESPSERIALLCRRFGADEYMSGETAVRAYMDTDLFHRHGVAVTIQRWTCPTYPQQHMARAGFIANLSILDLLMNVPREQLAPLLAPEDVDDAHRVAGPAAGR